MTVAELRASLKRARQKARAYRQKARHYSRQAKASRELAARRVKQIRERTHGPDAAVRWALKQAADGVVEHPAGSNWGPRIEDWIKASGYEGPVPWCQCFANAAAVHGGAPQLRTGYTPTVLAGIGGYIQIPASRAQRGDFVFYKWPGVSRDSCDHVGVLVDAPALSTVRAVEGNTSPGTGGSQNNGGGVYVRTRPRSVVVGFVRPLYPAL
jgi:hypothetical protein